MGAGHQGRRKTILRVEIINEKLKIGVLRTNCCGNIKNYLETYENIVCYDELRNNILKASLSKKLESDGNKKVSMDIGAVLQKVKE